MSAPGIGAEVSPDGLAPVRGFLTSVGGGVDIASIEHVGAASRNRLLRVLLTPGAPWRSIIIKEASAATDPYFAHHLRREERVLDLLARFAPGLAPRCLGMILDPAERGWLILEDVGNGSLAEQLAGLDASDASAALDAALARVRDLHGALHAHRAPFYRTCFAIDLDRFTARSVASRFTVAWRRLAVVAGSSPDPPPSARRAWSALMEPLLAAPRQMIHNSLSPLNLVVEQTAGTRIVDFETMTLGPACIDVAELLRQPFAPIDWETTARLAGVGGAGLQGLRLASLARALDYAGSNARQIQGADGVDGILASRLRLRLLWYCGEARELMIGVAGLRPVADLLAAILGDA